MRQLSHRNAHCGIVLLVVLIFGLLATTSPVHSLEDHASDVSGQCQKRQRSIELVIPSIEGQAFAEYGLHPASDGDFSRVRDDRVRVVKEERSWIGTAQPSWWIRVVERNRA